MAEKSALFKPLRLGRSELSNRVALAPLTRFRADDDHVPLQSLVPEYYAQRASVPGTLLITEATYVAPQAAGYPLAPGIWSQAQIDGWRPVTKAVHDNKSFIYMQLWALGRASRLEGLKKVAGPDAKVVSASDIPLEGGEKPTPLTEDEIRWYIGQFAQAAKNAIEAGFDGVEIHGANGYLVDQFTQDVSNQRTDEWGGSVENRARFALEVVKAVAEAVGSDRTAIRLSPFSDFQSMGMADPKPQFSYLVRELKKYSLAYIHLVESRVSGNADVEPTDKVNFLVDIWDNQSPVLLAGGFRPASALTAADEEFPNRDIIVVFGRFFISNPDLVFRLQKGIEFASYERGTFYNPGKPDGYTTYPFSKEYVEAQA
ncbi:putative nadh:flavin oxidoreductase nadh oxidase family protein [Diaporthe ampelina]|uniref:Putative nadh:flavin oxidoreductase nadh oxidase family protein n=1 Tax=Diaporthe ampelina TaxID=1214573 RepID=A0A0G2HSC0_9PEZI|nr:putative nadh:flavin oxidoreductase nadh oxidase family protein [Diaporthe ampelina]